MNILLVELAALRAAGPIVLAIICLCIAFYDCKYYVIPNELIVSGIALRFLRPHALAKSFLFALIFAGAIILASFFIWLITKKKIGNGDYKLIFMLSLYCSAQMNLIGLFISLLIGAIYTIITRKKKIPLGPCIVLGWFCAIIYFINI